MGKTSRALTFQLQIYLNEEYWHKLRNEADRQDRTLSYVARKIIENHFKKEEKNHDNR